MTYQQTALFAIFIAVFGLLLWGRIRYDLVAFSALIAGVLLGAVPAKDAFSGFGHPATLVVALVLVVSAGLVRSGAVMLITQNLISAARPLNRHIMVMGGVGAAMSSFMNNVAALALLMPVDMQTAKKSGRSPGLTLMPLSFATILGGMVTMIGTPPNIIIASIREDELGEPFKMFDFLPVGGVVALAGLVFVAVAGWRMIPRHAGDRDASEALLSEASYVSELTVPKGSKVIGKTIQELEAEGADLEILGLLRSQEARYLKSRTRRIEAGDAIALKGDPESLDEFRISHKLDFAKGNRQKWLESAPEGLDFVEVVVSEQSRICGKTSLSMGLAWRQGAILMGISRQGTKITRQVRKTVIKAGDILLLLVPSDRQEEIVDWLGALPLAGRGLKVTRESKTWLAIGIFTGAIAAASLGLVYMPIALGIVVALYLLSRIVPLTEVYTHIEWPVVVLLASMIPLGEALNDAGGTALVAGQLARFAGDLPPWAILAILMAVTMTLSDVLNNTATTIVAAPVGIQMAQSLGMSPDPFLMAVAVAASCAFLTPIGHKNNTLVLGPGGYRFGDYWKMGLPLEILVLLVSVPAILWFWPL